MIGAIFEAKNDTPERLSMDQVEATTSVTLTGVNCPRLRTSPEILTVMTSPECTSLVSAGRRIGNSFQRGRNSPPTYLKPLRKPVWDNTQVRAAPSPRGRRNLRTDDHI
jgi:hypothetical protein